MRIISCLADILKVFGMYNSHVFLQKEIKAYSGKPRRKTLPCPFKLRQNKL